MESTRDRKKSKFDLRLTCVKYLLFLLNAVFVIASVLTVSTAISTVIASSSYWMSNGFQILSIFWMVVGAIFMIVALFGILVAFKESTCLANLYGVAMTLVFILQIAAAITGFSLISHSRDMVSGQLDSMMRFYNYNYRQEVDWIQSKFECCGVNGPTDWQNFDQYSTPYPYVRDPYYYRTNDYYYQTPDYYNNYPSTESTTTTTTEAPRTDLMPASCCVRNSNYVNLTCEHYHTSGCFEPIHQIVSESIMLIGSSAIGFSVLQIFGIVLGFLYARVIRRKKTQRNVQIWNSGQEYSAAPGMVRQPPHTDYSQIVN